MEALIATPALADLRELHERLPAEEARKVKLLATVCVAFMQAKDKSALVREVASDPRFAPVADHLTVPTLYRKAQLWRESGSVLALADRRALRKAGACGLAANTEFVAYWQSLCCENARKTAPARRKLFRLLAAGERIPGMGTWRDLWAAEHGGMAPDEGMPCPYRPGVEEPQGWSTRNLMKIAPGKFALKAARTGMMAAQMDYGVEVRRTRVGLAPCQVVQIDDMWYEHKVAYSGNQHAQRVVEYSMVDVLTGHVVSWLTKPVRERADGTRETLKSKWTRYLVAHLLCDVGIPASRQCLIMGEHGTAAADDGLRAALAEISGGSVEYTPGGKVLKVVDGSIRFGAGGRLSQPLAKGLAGGRPKGNPRYKGLLEGMHALIKNELADVRGNVGGGRGLEPETVYGMDKQDEALRAIARALEAGRPGILDRLQLPYIPYSDFRQLIDEMYARLDARADHQMEGWEECGFVVGEWKPTPVSPWTPWRPDLIPMDQAKLFKFLIDERKVPYRTRRMSPGEAWNQRKGELAPLDPFVAPLVMGDELARLCTVSDRLQMVYRDDETLSKCHVTAMLQDGRTLERGGLYKVWVNPLSPFKAYVADAKGRFLGVAPVQVAARYDDAEAMEAQLGVRQAALAAERRRLAPVAAARLRDENERAAANAAAVLGHDPALDRARRAAAAKELAQVASAPALAEADFAPERAPGDDIRDEDFI